jgi:Calpain family cysteine protease
MTRPYLGLKSMSFISNDNLTSSLDDAVANDQQATGLRATTAPTAAATTGGLTQVLYLTEPGDSKAISVHDIHQGAYGDCFLLSSIGEIARVNPNFIKSMIQDNGNGTETVTLHSSRATDFLATVEVTVNNTFDRYGVNSGTTQDVVGDQKEIWPQVLEKAVAAEAPRTACPRLPMAATRSRRWRN